jgi:hypothetical protein
MKIHSEFLFVTRLPKLRQVKTAKKKKKPLTTPGLAAIDDTLIRGASSESDVMT